MAQAVRIRAVIDQIFASPNESPWDEFPPGLLSDLGFHHTTLLFYSVKHDALLLLLWRKEPSDESFVGNFPCGRKFLDWLVSQERGHKDPKEKGVKTAYIATIENAQENKIISFALAADVVSRLTGTLPFISSKSREEFFWLDEDLFPAQIHSKRRQFKQMTNVPMFLRKKEETSTK